MKVLYGVAQYFRISYLGLAGILLASSCTGHPIFHKSEKDAGIDNADGNSGGISLFGLIPQPDDGGVNIIDGCDNFIYKCECTNDAVKEEPCGSSVGECKQGTQKYICSDWEWKPSGRCRGEVKPRKEICDWKDNNCDGEIDEGLTKLVYVDSDMDGYGSNDIEPFLACNKYKLKRKESTKAEDCNDTNNQVHPGIDEICDAVDNDCDGKVDGITRKIYCGFKLTGTIIQQCKNGNYLDVGECEGESKGIIGRFCGVDYDAVRQDDNRIPSSGVSAIRDDIFSLGSLLGEKFVNNWRGEPHKQLPADYYGLAISAYDNKGVLSVSINSYTATFVVNNRETHNTQIYHALWGICGKIKTSFETKIGLRAYGSSHTSIEVTVYDFVGNSSCTRYNISPYYGNMCIAGTGCLINSGAARVLSEPCKK